MWRFAVVVTVFVCLLPGTSAAQQAQGAQPARQQTQVPDSLGKGFAKSWIAPVNVVYFPVKLAVGVVGAVLGGVGGFLTGGNRRTAEGIWKPMTGGTYFITPEIIDGQQSFLPLDGGPYLPPQHRPASSSQMYRQQLHGVQPFMPFVHGGQNAPLPAGPLPAPLDTTS